ncbi:MAG: methionyl-tRNA formyltransferase, partial [Deltaproteobacteria bacterium]|nr:methionyl-tRNA formyltransferase [Deltaproteobacteria bacterium]
VRLIDELLKTGDEIVGVVAGSVRPATGYWHVPPEYDVRAKAIESYLPLYEPEPSRLNSPEFLGAIRKTNPDFIVSGYYAKIFGDALLAIPPEGCVNLHPARLPEYRGLTPHFTHMLLGDDRNYITMHWLDAGVDTGDIIAWSSIEIRPEETGFETGRRLTEAGMEMLREYWPRVKDGTAPRLKQDESRASTFNFSWDIAEIDWTQSATQIWNLVRTLTRPLGGAWTMVGGRRVHVWGIEVVDPDGELAAARTLPGQVLAVTGRGMWVQCGQGQVRILDATPDDRPDTTLFELVAQFGGDMPLLLG